MRIAKSLDEIGDFSSTKATGTVLTIGNFDGVHRAHQRLLTQLVHRASELGAVPAALTFEPHPLKVVAPQFAPKLILTLDAKARWMEELGIEHLTILPFTEQVAHLSPEAFIKEVVVERLRPREVSRRSQLSFRPPAAGRRHSPGRARPTVRLPRGNHADA